MSAFLAAHTGSLIAAIAVIAAAIYGLVTNKSAKAGMAKANADAQQARAEQAQQQAAESAANAAAEKASKDALITAQQAAREAAQIPAEQLDDQGAALGILRNGE